ncbi:metallophosphoesterase [Bradyrhizobium sp. RDM4]|uniref:metallophosphoesterase n=1 Tax=Bradyrhizobium sp. RDM4 TaxID=3378765 RepID=UPI0038FCD609
MRLWIMSDIHLELTRGWDLPAGDARPDFDVMIVAGDLIPRAERGVRWLLERVPDRPVIYVMGNHEGTAATSTGPSRRLRPWPPARTCTCSRTRRCGSAA